MKNANKPAYPPNAGWEHSEAIGLTKRELFAMAAMQGILSGAPEFQGYPYYNPEQTGKMAVEYADALLKALEQ